MIWHTGTWGQAWDGRANNGADVAQIDTYVWKVHVKELDSHAIHNYIGHVNIIKQKIKIKWLLDNYCSGAQWIDNLTFDYEFIMNQLGM